MKVAIIGTVGVPAKYGGFETLAENIIQNKQSSDVKYTVYCSSKNYEQKIGEFNGATLHYIGFKANGIQSPIYDMMSIFHAIFHADVLLILGVSGCIILPFIKLFSKKKIIVNIDGLEHRRNKWRFCAKKFLKMSEWIAIKFANIIISDNKAIQDYVQKEYGINSELIAYGGDHVLCDTSNAQKQILNKFNLETKKYSLSICRIEPENNVHIILEAFSKSGDKLVFIGNWQNSDYGKNLQLTYSKYSNIQMLSSIYNQGILSVMRSNCLFYLHGHSAGGTNPSLVEAMFFKVPILAFNCIYNRETTENQADYFLDSDQLKYLISMPYSEFIKNANQMLNIAERRYKWEIISAEYEKLYISN